MNNLQVIPLHQNWDRLASCCEVVTEEWGGPKIVRVNMLKSSGESLPTSLILLRDDTVIGHSRLNGVPNMTNVCFVEMVVISKVLRGKGYGRYLMEETEKYCKNTLSIKTVYLATRGQEVFYSKLGYEQCEPSTIFGGCETSNVSNYIDRSAVYMKKDM